MTPEQIEQLVNSIVSQRLENAYVIMEKMAAVVEKVDNKSNLNRRAILLVKELAATNTKSYSATVALLERMLSREQGYKMRIETLERKVSELRNYADN